LYTNCKFQEYKKLTTKKEEQVLFKRKNKSKVLAMVLAMIMALTALAQPIFATPIRDYTHAETVLERSGTPAPEHMENVLLDEDMNFLLYTLQEPAIGMEGFEGPYCIDGYHYEAIDIVVMFRTPPAVALRLVDEATNPRSRSLGRASDHLFTGEALTAHNAFEAQLGSMAVPFSAGGIDIISSHYTLFNGMFMNVPAFMIEQIAALPEVFMVTPAFVHFTMEELRNMSEEQLMSRERLPVQQLSNSPTIIGVDPGTVTVEQGSGVVELTVTTANMPEGAWITLSEGSWGWPEEGVYVYGGPHFYIEDDEAQITLYVSAGATIGTHTPSIGAWGPGYLAHAVFTLVVEEGAPPCGPYVPHPEFNLGAKELFDIPYIHEVLGLTGAGVRVGVIDTGVDYRHPVFAQSLIPTHRYTPGLGYYTLPGGNFTIVAGRETGRGTSPNEASAGGTHTNHGTHVAGTIVAMAPDVQLYAFRVLASGVGTQPAGSVDRAIEYAYYLGLDVVNLSLGNRANTPWQSTSIALNIAALAGMVSVNAAGNDGDGGSTRQAGRGGWFSMGGGAPSTVLGITVGSGQAGGRHIVSIPNATINNDPAEIALTGAAVAPWSQEDMAGEFKYVWFNQLTVPTGGRNNPAEFWPFVDYVRDTLLDGGNIDGKVGVIMRGGGELVTKQHLVQELGGVAIIFVNHFDDNEHISGTVMNNAGQPIPAYSMRRNCGIAHFGPLATATYPLQTGVLDFGAIARIPTRDIWTFFSSVGPLGPSVSAQLPTSAFPATMHLLPHVLAPGQNILSANNTSHPTTIDGRPYIMMGGTSMSAPAVAGIVALMLQQRPGATPLEVRSRLMNTARPLTEYDGQYSILQVGAGFIDPVRALTVEPYLTTFHRTPFAGIEEWVGDDTGGIRWMFTNSWSYREMSSLSFGRVDMDYGVPASTATIPVSINNPGGTDWTVSYSLIMPTQQLEPHDGNWAMWGPRLDHTVSGVTVEINQLNPLQFEVTLTHDGTFENRGFAQGYLTFTRGDVVLNTPFGAYFNVPPLPVPLEPHPNNAIWRPILSNWLTTPYNYGEADPRAFSLVHPGAGWFLPGDIGMMTRSNYSALYFGFTDPNNGPARPINFYFAPYGYGIEDATLFGTGAPLASGTPTTYVNVVRSIKGGNLDTINTEQGIHVVWGAAQVLDPGAYTLFVRAIHGAGEEYDLVQAFTFVVTDERPSIELDNDEFYFEEGDEYITVTGRINSHGHDLAMKHNVLFRPTPGVIDAPFDYSTVSLRRDGTSIPVNPDGTFSFTVPAQEATHSMDVVDGVGQVILPIVIFGMILGWGNQPASCMISFNYTFDVKQYVPTVTTVFTWDIFNNGPEGTPSRPNQDLADAELIRMWTQLDYVGAPLPLAVADTITALDQNGNCAMEFVMLRRMWDDGQGWLDYFSIVDVNTNGEWEFITLSITVYGQSVEVLLHNR